MRIARQELERQAALARGLLDLALQGFALELPQPAQRIGNGRERGEPRVDTLAGVLEHHLDATAVAIARKAARGNERQVAGMEADESRGRVEQPGHQPHQRRFSAAGFADQADALALADGEADVVDGMHLRNRIRASGQAPAQAHEASRRLAYGKSPAEFRHVEKRDHDNGFQQAAPCIAPATMRGSAWSHAAVFRAQRSENRQGGKFFRRRSGSAPGIDASASSRAA